MEVLKLNKNDYGYNVNIQINNTYGSGYNTSGYTARMIIWDPQSSTNIMYSGSMTSLSASIGYWRATIGSGNFQSAGNYHGEIELRQGTTVRESTKTFKAIVMDSP